MVIAATAIGAIAFVIEFCGPSGVRDYNQGIFGLRSRTAKPKDGDDKIRQGRQGLLGGFYRSRL